MGFINFIGSIFSDTFIDEKCYDRYKASKKLVHRYMAEKRIGRKLKAGEVVHHKDRISRIIQNKIFGFLNQEEHDRVHKQDAVRYGKRLVTKDLRRKQRWLLGLAQINYNLQTNYG
ncbi:MAG: hypothetical protein IPN13_10880 [Bacteroidetes bacterium]|nr:hypothetical protein [Bacteroidota bacterium]